MSTIKEGAHYVKLPNGEFVSAGKARSMSKTETASCPERVAPVVRSELQHAVPQALDGHASKQKSGTKGTRICHVLIVRYGTRLLDDDNLATSYKSLRDAIAAKLEIDDGDPRIKFEYGQVTTTGLIGTHFVITRFDL